MLLLRRGFYACIIATMLLTLAGPTMPTLTSAAPNTPTETGVYTEDFTTYIVKDYADKAEWDIWSHNLRLTRYDGIGQSLPGIAVNRSDNTVFAVWGDNRNGNSDIYAQRLDPDGNRLWPNDIRINSDSGSADQYSPVIDLDKAGNVIIAWNDYRNGIDHNNDSDIYIQKINSNGNKLWVNDIRVNSDTGITAQEFPRITIDSSNNIIAVWYAGTGTNGDVYAQRLSESGVKAWAMDVRVNSNIASTVSQSDVGVAVDATGLCFVVWQDFRNSYADIYAQRLDWNGNKVWTGDIRVNSLSGGTSRSQPALAIDGGGNAFVMWADNSSGLADIYAQKIDANGNRLWIDEVRVNSDTGMANQKHPSVASDGNGNVVVAWWDTRNGYNFYAQKIAEDGTKFWADDLQINLDVGVGYVFPRPSVAVDSNANAFVVWNRSGNQYTDIYLQKMSASGNRLWKVDVRVNSDSGVVPQTYAHVATDNNGEFIVVWKDHRNYYADIYARRFDANGNKLWASDVRVNSYSVGSLDSPSVVLDNDGNATIVWLQDAQFGIHAQKLDKNGNKLWTADTRVDSNSTTTAIWSLSVSADHSGNAIVVWSDYRNGVPYDDNFDIFAQKISGSGNKLWANDIRVNSDVGNSAQTHPSVVIDSNGNAVVAWEDERSTDSDIYAQRLGGDGVKLWMSDKRINSDNGTANQSSPNLALETSGNIYVVWRDDRAGDDDIYAQLLNTNGSTSWITDIRANSDSGIAWQSEPLVATDSSRNAFVAWSDYRIDESGDGFAQKLGIDGSKLWSTDVRINSDNGEHYQSPQAMAVTLLTNQSLIVWNDDRNANSDIYLQKINSIGGKSWLADLQVVDPDVFYLPGGQAQSRAIDTIADDIRQATVTANYQLNGGSVEFALSNNGGTNWVTATLGTATVFTATGSDLRWRAVLTGDPVWRQRSPIVTSLRIEYSTAMPYADDYEADDACSQAKPIAVNGATQTHTLHQYADADWTWFDVISSTTYVLQTANPQLNADTTLELRPSCPQPPAATDDNAFGREARLTWRATFTGRVYAKVANHSPGIYGANTGYDLSVRTYTQPPVVVIVGGHDDGFTLQPNIDYLSDMAYRTFLNTGVPKANIRYFSPNPNRDVDGNGLNDDIFATATITNVRDAVQDWSRTRGVSLGVPFYLYLVDHGYYDQFLAAGSTGRVFAEQLNLWLSNLEATSGADNINVILEACKSGSFIDVTALGPNKISGRNRVVIASTSSTLDAYPSLQGAYFSDVFWTAVGQNQDLKTAFETAKQAVQATGLSQQPWLDDNGDAVASAQDGALARGRGLGLSFGDRAPAIDWVQVGDIASGTGTVQAEIRDDFGVDRAWVVVYPPGFAAPPPSSDPTTPVLNVPTRTLTLAGSDLFTASFNGFTQTGWYRVVAYAQDVERHQAVPQLMRVCVGCSLVYLPLVRK